jgi:predicted DNA-binding transcriptional regulator AlpA
MSYTPSVDPIKIKEKADELRKRFGGRELLTFQQVGSMLGCTRTSAYYRRKDGNFPLGRKDNGYNLVYPVDEVAAYLLYGKAGITQQPTVSEIPQARARRQAGPDAPKIGRPRKRRKAG